MVDLFRVHQCKHIQRRCSTSSLNLSKGIPFKTNTDNPTRFVQAPWNSFAFAFLVVDVEALHTKVKDKLWPVRLALDLTGAPLET